MKPANATPTGQELEIMKVVWKLGPATVRQVYEDLLDRRKIAYTTVPFEVREYYVDKQELIDSPEQRLAALFEGSGGALDVEVRCLSDTQYLGMARPDLYLLLDTASFGANFAKGFLGVWTRVVLITCVAVMFSTFLNTFVALLATAAVFLGGISMPYLKSVATGEAPGGGPLQAMVREFVDRVFNGAAEPLLVHLVEDERLTAKELDEIRRAVDRGRKS